MTKTLEDKLEGIRIKSEKSEKTRSPKKHEHAKKAEIVSDEIRNCPECGSAHIVKDYVHGDDVCEDCGLVISEKAIDQTGGENIYVNDPESAGKIHRGAPSDIMLHDKGLATEISPKNKDAYGKPLPTRNQAQIYRLRKWQRRTRLPNATDKNLAAAYAEIDRLSSNMGLPKSIRETATAIYKKAIFANMIRGRSIYGVVSASVYGACRQHNVPRTLDEVAEHSRVSRKEIGRTYRCMTRELKLYIAPVAPEDYIPRFCNELKLGNKTQNKTLEIITLANEKGASSGRGPTGVAAAAMYIAAVLCNERRSQREVADVAGITEVTIRNRYKEFCEVLDIKIDT